ncbi:chaperone protein ClpB1-like isoform X2 [Camellia sinensis]|uniref:chaperone protein ClpB1-like isoform X2 n=1 Tax=Camellia sinensis TaxID=4442 RepID=UPI0010358C5A|nr:chaperone protein ClpB1-like isoform X2 [Camellia sinensis]
MDKWDRFTRKSKPIMMSRTRSTRRAEELYMLEQLRHGLVSSLQEAEPNNKTKMKPIFGVAQSLSSLISELLLSTHENLKENLTVTPRLVAEVAGPLTGVPASWLLRCSEPPLQGLESRLAERLIGQDHVRFLISNALLRQRSGPRPVGSFLFLYGSGMGRTEHAKALAKQIFDNSDLLTEFDMSEYMDSDSVSRLIGVPSSYKECGVEGMLTEAVRRRPYSVILFDNVDMAHPAVVDVLIEILSHGRVLVDQGNSVDFTKTLIVLTSNAIDGNFRLWGCDCIWRSQDCPVKDNLYSDRWEQKHRCIYPSLLREARRYFKPELFEKLDDVIVFKCLSPEQSMTIGRLQLRDIASSITEKKLILYPSEAALRCMVMKGALGLHGGEVLRILLEENVVPLLFDMLTKNEIDDMSAVYIDALVGTKELSYRLEKRGSYVEDLFLKHFKESFRELRIMYRKEKERINMIYTLRRNFFQLMNLLNANAVADFGCVAEVVQKLLSTVDDLIRNTVDVNLTPSQNKLAPLNYSNEETQPTDTERSTKRAKNQVQGLCMVLCNRVVGQNQEAIDVVAEAMLKSILAPHDLPHRPTMSLLFLGLTRVGQADFVRSVAENFICDDGTDLLIQIDSSKYRDPDSLFQLIHGPLELPFHSQHGVPLLEIVQMRPHSILLFSQVEMAHISVFSALLSVLDQGTLSNVDGHTVDFRHTVVIFASNVGNRRLLAHLVGHASQDGASHEVIQQVNK